MKTRQNVALIKEFLTLRNESRFIEEIHPKELNAYITYGMRTRLYTFSITKDRQFEQARKASQSKQKDLKQKGKGSKPNALIALTEEELKLLVLYDTELLGTSIPEALLNTIWFNNRIHLSLNRYLEHQDMCRGDLQLCQTENEEEFFEHLES